MRQQFVPRVFLFPGSAWERKGRAALPLYELPLAGKACLARRARAEPGHEGQVWFRMHSCR